MKTIILKRISLLNFKGIHELTLDFERGVDSIYGRNGSGKTTIFDAFTWVLFGKDSKQSQTFDIKTLDANGVAIPKLPHEVTVTLDVDGEQITLARKCTEKWVKKRGSATEEFAGHEYERLYNDVPLPVEDWNDSIRQICPEDTFRKITNPHYFLNLEEKTQREYLFRLAGGLSNRDICVASGRKDFLELIDEVGDKRTIDSYKKEIAAKRNRLKPQIDELPARIDERQREIDVLSETDYKQVEQELEQRTKDLNDVVAQATSISARLDEQRNAKVGDMKRLAEVRNEIMRITSKTNDELCSSYYQQQSEITRLQSEQSLCRDRIRADKERFKTLVSDIEGMTQRREQLRQEFKEINAMRLEIDPSSFVCPTCGQQLDSDNIDRKVEELQAQFNDRKAKLLDENKAKGAKCSKTLIAEACGQQAELQSRIDETVYMLNDITDKLANIKKIQMPGEDEITAALNANPHYIELQRMEAELRAKIDELPNDEPTGTAEIESRKESILTDIYRLRDTLGKRDMIRRNKDRIAELTSELRELSEEYARLERIEFLIAEFMKYRIETVENKINSMFNTVRFRMYKKQINGGERETCEALVNGVPYSSLNNAGKINAGLEIIDAICMTEGITAPIFIDNAESVNRLTPMHSQLIRLVVSDDAKLRKGGEERETV